MKRVFFIDYENVDTKGLDGVSKLTSQDQVFIFYSEAHSRLTFGLHRRICESSADFQYQKITDKTKNALDKALIQKATEEINDKKDDYYIISKDKGYQEFIREKILDGYKVYQFPVITEANDSKREELRKIIQERLISDEIKPFDLDDNEVDRIVSMIMKNADNKSELKEDLQKMFYNKDVKYILTRLKDITYNR